MLNVLPMMAIGIPELVILTIPIVLIALLVSRCRQSARACRSRPAADEALLMQQIYEGLTKLDRRVEALETVLLDSGKQVPPEAASVHREE